MKESSLGNDRARSIAEGMIDPSASPDQLRAISDVISSLPIEFLEIMQEGGTQFRPLGKGEKYVDASAELQKLGIDVDRWPTAPSGLFVVSEQTVYLRSVEPMAVAHEAFHALDASLGKGQYISSTDPLIRSEFRNAVSFVTPYAATGIDEFVAEAGRAYLGINSPNSPWPAVSPERLRETSPGMSAFFDDVISRQRERSLSKPQEIEAVQPPEVTPPSEKSSKRDYRQEVTDRIIAALENGTAPWQKGWEAGESSIPINPTTGKEYRGGNAVRLMLEGREDPRWMTYKQAAAEGWQVRKGERGVQIEYWKFGDDKRDEKSADRGNAADITVKGSEDDEPRSSRPRVFYATVFNAEQIDGVPQRERKEMTWTTSERVEEFLAAVGVDVKYGGDKAYFTPSRPNEINLPNKEQFHDEVAFADTALHELSHLTGTKDRLDRDLTGRFGSESYAKEELRAEIAGAMIAAQLGIARDTDNNAAYVASWIKVLQNDKNEIFRAASAAQQISDFVFEKALERVQEVGEVAPPDISALPVYTPGPNELVTNREDMSSGLPQIAAVIGRSEDSSRVLGREGAGVLSLPAASFSEAPKTDDVVRVTRVEAKDQVETLQPEFALER